MDKLIRAMETAGYYYDDICSYDEWVHFFSDYGSLVFSNWEGVREWLNGVVFDDPEISDAVEKIMRGGENEQ